MMSIEQGTFRRRLTATGASVACAAALFGSLPKSVEAEPVGTTGVADCAPYFNSRGVQSGQYRACFDYMVDAVGSSLEGYYKFGRSPIGVVADLATHHFETRYFPPARDEFEQKVTTWPQGVNKVYDKIGLLGLSVNLKQKRAVIRTREQWRVINANGQNLLPKALARPHTEGHTMCYARQRITPSLPILKPYPEWLVVENQADPSFNCNHFAAELASGEIT